MRMGSADRQRFNKEFQKVMRACVEQRMEKGGFRKCDVGERETSRNGNQLFKRNAIDALQGMVGYAQVKEDMMI